MELANVHLEELLRDLQEKVLGEGRAITRDKATERMRARIPEPQKKLEGREWTKLAKKKGKGSVQHLGEAKDAEQLIDEEEEPEDPDLEAHDPDLEAAERSAMARRIKGAKY